MAKSQGHVNTATVVQRVRRDAADLENDFPSLAKFRVRTAWLNNATLGVLQKPPRDSTRMLFAGLSVRDPKHENEWNLHL